jgi:hypothetical protein
MTFLKNFESEILKLTFSSSSSANPIELTHVSMTA